MKHTKNIIMTTALALCLASPALAATLKQSGAITTPTITVGDVFDGAGKDAERYLAPAPLAGEATTLTARDLNRIADAVGLEWKAGKGESITLTRTSNDITRAEIAAALENRIAQELQGQDVEAELSENTSALRLPANAAHDIAVSDLSVNLQKGVFTAKISADNGAASKTVTGRLHAMAEVPVLKSQLSADDIISIEDITHVRMRAAALGNNVITSAEDIVGLTPRRGLSAMKPLTPSDIVLPLSVKKGDLVTIVLQNGVMNLTLQGRAMQNGSVGETVRIVNTNSNRMLEGTVTGPQTVTMTLPSAKL